MDLNEVQEGVLNICLPRRRRAGAAAARPQGSARHARLSSPNMPPNSPPNTATSPSRPSARSSASSWCWKTRAAPNSSASLRSRSRTSSATDRDGRGYINILAADKLMENPRLYATFLLWLLSELFEELPEVGDLAKPKLVFLLRRGASPVQRRAQGAAGQDRAGGAADPLQGRRGLFRDAKSARRAGQGAGAARQPRPARVARLHPARPEGGEGGGRDVPPNPKLDTAKVIMELGKGRGAGVVPRRQRHALDGRALHGPPAVGAARPDHAGGAQGASWRKSPVKGKYDQAVDSESAYESAPEARCTRPARPRRRRQAAGGAQGGTAEARPPAAFGSFMAGVGVCWAASSAPAARAAHD